MQSIYRAILQTAQYNSLLSQTVSIGKPLRSPTEQPLWIAGEILMGQMLFLEPN